MGCRKEFDGSAHKNMLNLLKYEGQRNFAKRRQMHSSVTELNERATTNTACNRVHTV